LALADLTDESLLHLYNNIRDQVAADRAHKHKFIGDSVRQYAEELRSELIRRRVEHTPIDWSHL
jgi:hypothetical protein